MKCLNGLEEGEQFISYHKSEIENYVNKPFYFEDA